MSKKQATLVVIGHLHNGDHVIENVLNYVIGSIHADLDEMMTNGLCDWDFNTMVKQFYAYQENFDYMKTHRRLFHLVLSTRASKDMYRTLEEGARSLMEYFVAHEFPCVMVPHCSSDYNVNHVHWHIVVGTKSMDSERTLRDKYATFQNMVDHLNNDPRTGTYTQWDKVYTTHKTVNAEEYL